MTSRWCWLIHPAKATTRNWSGYGNWPIPAEDNRRHVQSHPSPRAAPQSWKLLNNRRLEAVRVFGHYAFTSDPDRLARFEREAKVLASLNHPNIGSIYGLEEAEGVRALVLELVEGPTLADRIKQRPIPLDEALPIAKQIAEALEAAHERGVIHRDLKPATVASGIEGCYVGVSADCRRPSRGGSRRPVPGRPRSLCLHVAPARRCAHGPYQRV